MGRKVPFFHQAPVYFLLQLANNSSQSNPLILEFFERGPRLEDNSNRYQQTCRKCGIVFPKGRNETLTDHLMKKCQAISLQDRRRAVNRICDLPDDIGTYGSNDTANENASRQGNEMSYSGLDVLAEASNRMGPREQKNHDNHMYHNGNVPVDPALEDAGFQRPDSGQNDIGDFRFPRKLFNGLLSWCLSQSRSLTRL